MKKFRPYHRACDGILGPDEDSEEAVRQKADETEDWRICRNCHDYINGSADVMTRPVEGVAAVEQGPSHEGPATAILTAGLLFGDESKGATVDWLASQTRAHTVVRYCGGPQAAHRVVLPDGRVHVFAQFGSGTFCGAQTHLSRHMLVDPLRLVSEAEVLIRVGVERPLSLVTIDERAPLVTPLHRIACQARERARGKDRHGSCGMGIWEATRFAREHYEQAPLARDLRNPVELFDKLLALKLHLVEELRPLAGGSGALTYRELSGYDVTALHARYRELDFQENTNLGRASIVGRGFLSERMRRGTTIFEGSQGVLLDENLGFHPHTTGSTTTFANAQQILSESDFTGKVRRIGITRCYATRHGPGPLPTETSSRVVEAHNKEHMWAGDFRVGWLDLVLLRHALRLLGPVDELAVSHLDQWSHFGKVAAAYEPGIGEDERYLCRYGAALRTVSGLSERYTRAAGRMRPMLVEVDRPVELIEDELGYPVTITADGPARSDRCARR